MAPRAPRNIEIINARTHNLKGVSVEIPAGKLTVITGVSGSGKSSLAFDTLFAEGQRRYVESLSTYARQFIEKMARPEVEAIRNIQPSIAIEQKNSVKNARSTIGTATEIHDYLRLLYARAGVTICPECKVPVREDSPQGAAAVLFEHHVGQRAYVVAPLPREGKARPAALRAELIRAGLTRLFHADGDAPAVVDLEDAADSVVKPLLSGATIPVLIDRLVLNEDDRERVSSSLASAFQAGRGHLKVWAETASGSLREHSFSTGFRCNGCGQVFQRPEPNLFSFNSPIGACAKCNGFGRTITIDWDKVIPDRRLSLDARPIAPFNTPSYKGNYKWVREIADASGLSTTKPLDRFTRAEWDTLINGAKGVDGLREFFAHLEKERYKVQSRILLAKYRGFVQCPDCGGSRLVPAALNIVWGPLDSSMPPRHIGEMISLSVRDILAGLMRVKLRPAEEALYGRIFREILSRLTYLVRVGLGYLTLSRQTRTLSGGEAQRINLATALGTALTQTLYVLDEPTVGLHPRDSDRLLGIMKDLRAMGNTVVVVEHDPGIILGADHLVDMGPRAGSHGGRVVYSGPPDKLSSAGGESLTAEYLGKSARPLPRKAAIARNAPVVRIEDASEHNLKGITVSIPLHCFVCITGVSGSGKSTLVHNVLYQGFNQHAGRPAEDLGSFGRIAGLDRLDEMILVDQSPIGRSARSNPVTYVKAYDPIRKLFAGTREAKAIGLTEGNFSFNVPGGRCEACEGSGVVTYDMHFLPEMTLPCESCGGKRFQNRVLEVAWRSKTIDDVLSMTVDDASEFFAQETAVVRRLLPLREVGLGYLTLGQSTATLSGGEAQRLKLASHLATGADGTRTMMIFDEPTTGLHLSDLDVLAAVFAKLVDHGYSLVVIEHNLDIIRRADWIIDLGPEGGDEGGFVVAEGPPAAIAKAKGSHTGRFLRR